MLCILAIRLLLAYSFGSDLGGIANPQLEVQFRQQSLEPARMPTGFYPHTHFHSWCCEVTVELFRFLRVLQSPLSKFSSVGIHKRNLLEARVVVTSYNDHLRLLSPEPVGWFSTTNFTRASEPTLSWNHFTHNAALSVASFCALLRDSNSACNAELVFTSNVRDQHSVYARRTRAGLPAYPSHFWISGAIAACACLMSLRFP